MKSGVYAIVNTLTGRRYIGSTKNLTKRKKSHFSTLRLGCHHNVWLQRSYEKHGRKAFRFDIVEECAQDILFAREEHYINEARFNNVDLYNIGSVGGGDNTSKHPLNAEIRKKISKSQMGRKTTPRYGSDNPNWRGGIQKCQKCKSDLLRGNRSGFCQNCYDKSGARNPFYGKTHSDENRKKASERRKGILPTNTREVVINGIEYVSLTEASRQLCVVPATIVFRINSKRYPGYMYKDELPDVIQGSLLW